MNERCKTCDDLWRAYGKATTEHVRLLKEEGALVWDIDRFREFEARIDIAAGVRERGRIAIKLHLAKDHPEKPRVAASAQTG